MNILEMMYERKKDILDDIKRTTEKLNEYHTELVDINTAISKVEREDDIQLG